MKREFHPLVSLAAFPIGRMRTETMNARGGSARSLVRVLLARLAASWRERLPASALCAALISGLSVNAQQTAAPRAPLQAPAGAAAVEPTDADASQNTSQAKHSRSKPKAVSFLDEAETMWETFSAKIGSSRLKSSERIPPVSVRFTPASESVEAAMTEDLSVMSRLLERSLDRALRNVPREQRANITLWISGSRSVRAMYVEPFGALFMVKVNVPLLGPPAPLPLKTKAGAANTEWDKARDELAELAVESESFSEAFSSDDEERFDPALVDALQTALLQTLKEAANIRGLKSSEYVAISVFGPVAEGTPLALPTVTSGKDSGRSRHSTMLALDNVRHVGTVLGVRASVEDVVAFAQGKIDFAAFKQKAQTHRYPGIGYKLTSVNSWALPSRSGARTVAPSREPTVDRR